MDNNTQFRNALNFLLFSYFGITLDYEDKNIDKDNILSCAVKKAFTDATQRGAYYAKSKNKEETEEEKKEKKKKKEAFREATQKALPEATECLKDGINKILEKEVPFDKQDSFDEWHENLCDNIKESFDKWHKKLCDNSKEKSEDSLPFTYGNAQKWVNMTLKYLYLIDCICSEVCPDIDCFHSLQNISAYLHVPVDSYIIEKVWEMEMEDNKTGCDKSCLPIKSGKTCKNGSRGKYNSDKVEAWSTWDKKTYENFQDKLRDKDEIDDNPIDWEGPAWIEIAKKRSGKDKR